MHRDSSRGWPCTAQLPVTVSSIDTSRCSACGVTAAMASVVSSARSSVAVLIGLVESARRETSARSWARPVSRAVLRIIGTTERWASAGRSIASSSSR